MILRSEIILAASVLSGFGLAVGTRSSEGGRPRGVGPEFGKFYKSTGTFACISNPSIVIPSSRVNDDFCDCPDGSDEPGTSACSYLSPLSPYNHPPGHPSSSPVENLTLALPGFYCKNKGHQPGYLRFESVNDGRCDYDICCDGSDEWANVGGTKCPDRCAEFGKEWKKHEDMRNKKYAAAMKKRKEYIATAATLKREIESKAEGLDIKIKGDERKVKEAQENLREVERKEQLRVVKGDAAGKRQGKTGVLLGLAKGRVEELRVALEQTKKYRDSMLERVGELETILATLKTERNPNFNDEGVKRAVRSWEDYAARETDDHWTDAENRDLEAIIKEDGEENGVNWAEFEGADVEEDDVAALYQFTNYLPLGVQAWLNDKIATIRELLVENGVLAAPGSGADISESKAVQTARKTLTEAEKDLENAKQDLENARNDLAKDYGPDHIFRALQGQCVSKESGEYVYELCFLDKTKQRSKKGGADTNMGNFAGFEIETVDEDLPLDGKGLGSGERVVMKYENGQSCWNGPNRSTRVILACNEEEEIWKISESEKCVYRMEVGTAVVCGFGNSAKTNDDEGKKDEL